MTLRDEVKAAMLACEDGLGSYTYVGDEAADGSIVIDGVVNFDRLADAAIAIARPIIEREAFERAAKVADKQAYAHGGEYFDGPELNSAHIANRIRTLSTDKGDEG